MMLEKIQSVPKWWVVTSVGCWWWCICGEMWDDRESRDMDGSQDDQWPQHYDHDQHEKSGGDVPILDMCISRQDIQRKKWPGKSRDVPLYSHSLFPDTEWHPVTVVITLVTLQTFVRCLTTDRSSVISVIQSSLFIIFVWIFQCKLNSLGGRPYCCLFVCCL